MVISKNIVSLSFTSERWLLWRQIKSYLNKNMCDWFDQLHVVHSMSWIRKWSSQTSNTSLVQKQCFCFFGSYIYSYKEVSWVLLSSHKKIYTNLQLKFLSFLLVLLFKVHHLFSNQSFSLEISWKNKNKQNVNRGLHSCLAVCPVLRSWEKKLSLEGTSLVN